MNQYGRKEKFDPHSLISYCLFATVTALNLGKLTDRYWLHEASSICNSCLSLHGASNLDALDSKPYHQRGKLNVNRFDA